jgi:hypothetical protein
VDGKSYKTSQSCNDGIHWRLQYISTADGYRQLCFKLIISVIKPSKFKILFTKGTLYITQKRWGLSDMNAHVFHDCNQMLVIR